VNSLAERWPTLSALPRLTLAGLPTPLVEMPVLSERLDTEVWVKHDDVTAHAYGGNKVRKLEYLLADARQRGADTLITTGAVGSHHVFATALFGRDHGFETHAVLVPQPTTPHVEEQVRAMLSVRARLHVAEHYREVPRRMAALVVKLRLMGRKPFVIPAGGSSVRGTLGYVNAGVELAQQLDAGRGNDPDAIYVACGTCATAAGLALGLAAAGVRTRVVAVRVTDRLLANKLRLSVLVKKTSELVRSIEPRFPEVSARAIASLDVDAIELGKGYGKPTPSSEAARRLASHDGLELDPTYTSKALACLLREAEAEMHGKRLIYLHTLSSVDMTPYLKSAPPIPDEIFSLLR
jgi:1-aminocyclopropane-1-carboxylate deaminase/D-cysteine desulfhydrase-like pyridoxal-dependent ACC family enzyme